MKPTLLVLAAGMGSRYGGLKQLDGVGPAEETIMDYSVYDAIRAGFGKVVFVIRESFAEEFKTRVTDKFSNQVNVEFVFQEVNAPIKGVDELPERQKPWGTAHAMMMAADVIKEPFAVINADDYYGISSFQKMATFLTNTATPDHYGMVGYVLSKTISDNGTVSRGVCSLGENNLLESITESHHIERVNGIIQHVKDGVAYPLTEGTLVSMNFFGFHPAIFEYSRKMFVDFVKDNYENPKAEFYIPLVVNTMMENGDLKVTVLDCDEKWYGVTYKEDKEDVQNALLKFTENGRYTNPLWSSIKPLVG